MKHTDNTTWPVPGGTTTGTGTSADEAGELRQGQRATAHLDAVEQERPAGVEGLRARRRTVGW
ncbi:MAG: hypothetical protein R2713_10715 [Ilumatobacteraceae bacterium]